MSRSEPDIEALDRQLAAVRAEQVARAGAAWANLWLAHRWPQPGTDHYGQRCIRVGSRPVCRRCAALYPLALLVALASAAGRPPWPTSFDPGIVWLLSLPATVAYGGEALGLFPYRARWQVATTLMAALAFGRALGSELLDRWSAVFWGPIAVFGGIWFFATVIGMRWPGRHRAATASSSSSSVL